MPEPGQPVVRVSPPAVAIETAFLTSGLPADRRQEAAARVTEAVRARGVAPAFIGVIDGRPTIGLEPDELQLLGESGLKLSKRDLAAAGARGQTGGATVSAAIFLARRGGLSVGATGGIGGVHRAASPVDVSADLFELAHTPIVLVCSGAKAILDLQATVELLETLGVTILGLRTDEFPAFWTASSGIRVGSSVEDVEEAARIWVHSRALGAEGALLLCVPPPEGLALPAADSEAAVSRSLAELDGSGVSGPAVTPFLLARIAHYTEGRSVEANLALLENNAAIAAELARSLQNNSAP